MRYSSYDAVHRLFQQQGCETRNQTLTSENLHPAEKVHASLAHQVDKSVCHMRSTFQKRLDTIARNHSDTRVLDGFCGRKVFPLAKAAQYTEYGRRLQHRDR